MTYDWTAPTRAELHAQAEVDEAIAHDEAETERLRDILTQAIADVRALSFHFGSPCEHYDVEHITGALDDMLPPAAEVVSDRLRWAAAMWELDGLEDAA
jgi:hypothetical protein